MLVTVPSDWREKLPKTSSMDFAKKIAAIIWGSLFGHCMEIVYVLDDDVDPTDMKDVLWAIPTRCHPTDRQSVEVGPILPLLTCCSHEERKAARGPKIVHDCLLPEDGKGRAKVSSFEGVYPEDVRRKVMAHWRW